MHKRLDYITFLEMNTILRIIFKKISDFVRFSGDDFNGVCRANDV